MGLHDLELLEPRTSTFSMVSKMILMITHTLTIICRYTKQIKAQDEAYVQKKKIQSYGKRQRKYIEYDVIFFYFRSCVKP